MTNIKYNLSKTTPPMMPRLGKGTECVQLLLSQVSKDMHQPLVPMLFSILGAHVSGAEFMYPDQSWKKMCGMLANLMADATLQRHFRTHGLLLQASPRTRRMHSTPRQIRRRLLQAPRRISRPACHLQGTLHHQTAQPTRRPACCRHGLACRPRRLRHSLGHLQARARVGMEGRK